MHNKFLFKLLLFLIAISFFTNPAFAVSPAAKSQDDYVYLLRQLRDIQIMVSNFANEDQKKKFTEVKDDFRSASIDFYAHNFVYYDKDAKKHRIKYYLVKSKLVVLLEDLAREYIKRTENILRSTSKQTFNILVKYNKGGYAKYFIQPVNPVSVIKQQKIYQPDEYHLYHDKSVIEEYIRRGYKALEDGKRAFNDPEVAMLKTKKERRNEDLNFMIGKYYDTIAQCRKAKMLGIEIYKTIHLYNLMTVRTTLEKYDIPTANPEPIFDVRIPEDFKVDANDNLQLIHSHEMKKLPEGYPKGPTVQIEEQEASQQPVQEQTKAAEQTNQPK